MTTSLQKEIVQEVLALVSENWDRITANIEIDDVDGEIIMSPKSNYFVEGQSNELRLGIDATDCFEELREKMARNANQPWTICDLEILNNGAFKFQFSYDEPPRLAKLRN